jgi:hypothetical protein
MQIYCICTKKIIILQLKNLDEKELGWLPNGDSEQLQLHLEQVLQCRLLLELECLQKMLFLEQLELQNLMKH